MQPSGSLISSTHCTNSKYIELITEKIKNEEEGSEDLSNEKNQSIHKLDSFYKILGS